MNVNSEDITVAWGQQPHPLDAQYGRWRLAVFQDVQESLDQSKLYFLYDPDADERSLTTGARKGASSIVVFDLKLRCFVAELPISVYGKPKFLFALKAPSSAGGTSLILASETEDNSFFQLHLNRVDMWAEGNAIAGQVNLLQTPISMAGEYIVSMREDAPELVVMANPGLQVWRIDGMASGPSQPTSYFSVADAQLDHFYDGFLSMGSVYLLSAFADGNLDYSRVHVLNLQSPGQINTHTCHADPARGMPPPRKQAAIDSISGYILIAGGEIEYGGNVTRLSDYWVLDLTTFQWTQVPASMPVPLIEPRFTTTNSGNVYLWGDFDQPLPGMPPGTHLRILRITGFGQKAPPPPYQEATAYPSLADQKPPLPQQPQAYPAAPNAPYPSNTAPYPPVGSAQAPPYPSYHPNSAAVYGQPAGQPYPSPQPSHQQQPYPPQQQYPGGPSYDQAGGSQAPGMNAYYPPQKQKKDKDCSLM